jgi:glycosyltransferase involved in cell wall biosynthesis
MTRLRVALVCIGIGRFQRGFERYFSDLFEVLRGEIDITLFVGAQADGVQHVVPAGLGWLTSLAHRLPVGRVDTEYGQYKHDCLAYGLALLPALRQGRFDVVHVIDPPLAKVVERLLPWVSRRSRLMFTNGTAWPARICPRRAHIQHVQKDSYDRALADGDAPARNSLVPCGIHPERFELSATREALRQRYGVPAESFVVLVVAAVKRAHKRVDHIIEEVAQLPGDVLLWIDGKPEDADVVALAERKLGARCRITYVPSAEVGALYKLCDVFVHAALDESFGLTVVEAMSAARPVLVHDSSHFEWLAGSSDPLVDMRKPGALAARLSAVRDGVDVAADPASVQQRAAELRRRFGWQGLRSEYLALYRELARTR